MGDDLPKVLWVYKTTTRSTTREALLLLAYGYEAMVPELGAGLVRRDNLNLEQNMILQWLELYFSKKKCHYSQLRVTAYQWRIAQYFN